MIFIRKHAVFPVHRNAVYKEGIRPAVVDENELRRAILRKRIDFHRRVCKVHDFRISDGNKIDDIVITAAVAPQDDPHGFVLARRHREACGIPSAAKRRNGCAKNECFLGRNLCSREQSAVAPSFALMNIIARRAVVSNRIEAANARPDFRVGKLDRDTRVLRNLHAVCLGNKIIAFGSEIIRALGKHCGKASIFCLTFEQLVTVCAYCGHCNVACTAEPVLYRNRARDLSVFFAFKRAILFYHDFRRNESALGDRFDGIAVHQNRVGASRNGDLYRRIRPNGDLPVRDLLAVDRNRSAVRQFDVVGLFDLNVFEGRQGVFGRYRLIAAVRARSDTDDTDAKCGAVDILTCTDTGDFLAVEEHDEQIAVGEIYRFKFAYAVEIAGRLRTLLRFEHEVRAQTPIARTCRIHLHGSSAFVADAQPVTGPLVDMRVYRHLHRKIARIRLVQIEVSRFKRFVVLQRRRGNGTVCIFRHLQRPIRVEDKIAVTVEICICKLLL